MTLVGEITKINELHQANPQNHLSFFRKAINDFKRIIAGSLTFKSADIPSMYIGISKSGDDLWLKIGISDNIGKRTHSKDHEDIEILVQLLFKTHSHIQTLETYLKRVFKQQEICLPGFTERVDLVKFMDVFEVSKKIPRTHFFAAIFAACLFSKIAKDNVTHVIGAPLSDEPLLIDPSELYAALSVDPDLESKHQ